MQKSQSQNAVKSKSATKYTQSSMNTSAIKSNQYLHTSQKGTKSQPRNNYRSSNNVKVTDSGVCTPKMSEKSINFEHMVKQVTQTVIPSSLKQDLE